MRSDKRGCDLRGYIERLAESHARRLQSQSQRHSVDELHRDEMHSVHFFDLINMGNVRMVESGGGSRLANETLHAIAMRSNICRQNLQRNFAVEFCILGQIHLAHPARAELRD